MLPSSATSNYEPSHTKHTNHTIVNFFFCYKIHLLCVSVLERGCVTHIVYNWDTLIQVPSSEFQVPSSSEYRVVKFRVLSSEFQVSSYKFRIPSSISQVPLQVKQHIFTREYLYYYQLIGFYLILLNFYRVLQKEIEMVLSVYVSWTTFIRFYLKFYSSGSVLGF